MFFSRSPEPEYGALRPEEGAAWDEVLSAARPGEPASASGRGCWRVLRLAEELLAGLRWLPAGHWFGDRSVETAVLVDLVVPPHLRGRGFERSLLVGQLEELAAAGVPLATASSGCLPAFRSAGYDRAGRWTSYRVPLEACELPGEGPAARPMTVADEPAVRALYERACREDHGRLDRRDPGLWETVFRPPGAAASGVVWDGKAVLEAYLIYRLPGGGGPVEVLDWAAASPSSSAAVLRFLGGLRREAAEALVPGAPHEPLFDLLEEPREEVAEAGDLLVRVVDAVAAVAVRGFSQEVDEEVHLALEDEVLAKNQGAFVLRVKDGRGSLTPGGDGAVTLDIRAFAPLFTGHRTAAELARTRGLRGSQLDQAKLGRVFGGGRPWMGRG